MPSIYLKIYQENLELSQSLLHATHYFDIRRTKSICNILGRMANRLLYSLIVSIINVQIRFSLTRVSMISMVFDSPRDQ